MAPNTRRVAASSHVREKHARRRAEIVQAALEAFRERGYHHTTLEDIARRLGIRNTALYHYFPDKDAILYECHRESLTEVQRIVEDARRRPTAAERLAKVIREHVVVMTETLQGSPLAFEVTALPPGQREEIIAARDHYERAIRTIIDDGIRTGEFRPLDAKLTAFAILGAINWIARWYRPDGQTSGRDLGSQFADYLVGGLTCRLPQ